MPQTMRAFIIFPNSSGHVATDARYSGLLVGLVISEENESHILKPFHVMIV